MNHDFTDITIVLDRSGSMITIWEETISSFKDFVKTQEGTPGRCQITLTLFGHEHDIAFVAKNPSEIDVAKTLALYPPRGFTAMRDAIGKAIVETGERLARMAEVDRPGNVLFVVITDGQENASKEYTQAQIAKMIKHQQEKYDWDFSVMGANIDAITTGQQINVNPNASLNFDPTNAGIKSAMADLANSATLYRTAKTISPDTKYVVKKTTVDA